MDWNSKFAERAKTMRAMKVGELLKLVNNPKIISLAAGMPSPTYFPTKKIAEIAWEVIMNHPDKSLQYSPTEGVPELREVLVKMAKAEELENIEIDNVIVTTASQEGLFLLALVFINPGDTIIVEAPSYVGGLQAFSIFQPNFWTVPLDKDGIRVDLLDEKLKEAEGKGIDIKFIYLVPNFHNPAGVTLSLKRRLKSIELSHRYNVPIIEDDPYGELRFEGEKIPSLVQLDRIGNIISVRTFSKRLFPGLRVGCIIADSEVIRKIALVKQPVDLCSPALTQWIAAEFIRRGYMKSYLDKIKQEYKKKRDIMLAALEKYFPKEVQWTRPQGGMFIWVKVPEYIDTDELIKEAIEEQVAYVPGSDFYPHREDKNHFRLNFSLPSPEQIEIGIQRLGNLLKRKIQSH